ncbi:MAG TPA: globin domain-containing protein [Acidimicrobiia bacterium]|nr:globin domain-containing protein [Acidimicrobiia bacterium]
MTPEQIALVEQSLASIDVGALAADFYFRAFNADTQLSAMFTTDPKVQQTRFAAELKVIVSAMHRPQDFREETHELGRRHRGFGVRPGHYRVMGDALLAALEAALGERWDDELAEAWREAFRLTAESMLEGAGPSLSDER